MGQIWGNFEKDDIYILIICLIYKLKGLINPCLSSISDALITENKYHLDAINYTNIANYML